MAIQCIIFDYDGVIVDSFNEMHAVYQILCKELGYDCPTNPEVFRKMYGRDYTTLYVSLGIPEKLWKKGSAIYYREIVRRNSLPFSLIENQLKTLGKQFSLYLVSATFRKEIETKLKRHHLYPYFKGISARKHYTDNFHKVDAIKHILKTEGIRTNEAIYIGDMNSDYERARKAGLKHILILDYGWGNTIKTNQATKVKQQEDLLNAIKKCDHSKALFGDKKIVD